LQHLLPILMPSLKVVNHHMELEYFLAATRIIP
jgi:hypothetical protein